MWSTLRTVPGISTTSQNMNWAIEVPVFFSTISTVWNPLKQPQLFADTRRTGRRGRDEGDERWTAPRSRRARCGHLRGHSRSAYQPTARTWALLGWNGPD